MPTLPFTSQHLILKSLLVLAETLKLKFEIYTKITTGFALEIKVTKLYLHMYGTSSALLPVVCNMENDSAKQSLISTIIQPLTHSDA